MPGLPVQTRAKAFALSPGHRAGALLACQLERKAASRKLTRQGRSIQYVKDAEGHGEQKLRQSARLGLKELSQRNLMRHIARGRIVAMGSPQF